ncbi:SRR1-like protein isoform X2 [Odontomachus brunneus]|uniref:SRR1-like protein isoform X1 n=1 Tax=Odontomachus brunneus TaxID=486640 RepID=UPI0013F1EF0B|nr:SRR1-like protein isoform X1 [Odontomachus brunneus]XP_032681524.1 SRR1-like protein isoform X2 [Odontomachus brunneus]
MPGASDFVLVSRRRRHCDGRRILNKGAKVAQIPENYEIDCKHLLRALDRTLVEIRDTPFVKLILSHLTDSLTVLNSNGISEIVCYGLGRFSQYRSSRCQLALLLYLKERYGARVYAYDPIFYPEEVQALRALGLEIIETNEEGKRVVRDEITTLVFMPHCSKQLTNNFLYANWGSGLSNCILFANSFTKIINDCLRREILETTGYILRIQPYVTEIPLENSFVHETVFNDLSIHIFIKQDLLRASSDFWDFREEPRYSLDEIKFLSATTR